jgi:hypothetical protein
VPQIERKGPLRGLPPRDRAAFIEGKPARVGDPFPMAMQRRQNLDTGSTGRGKRGAKATDRNDGPQNSHPIIGGDVCSGSLPHSGP